ncbi:F-box/WD repeat-containing protein 4-like [Plakobranchus ocellatus]|uniref:F-box/WD repeat-containing protein 4-like n=1 Tax=Plakobranchus ocellatus TaxID=259542 RepID=A0AAV3Z686_9GAST|nr:F-box/WD repeat-containing protein 4-like [Plakobranchus ocellatus]
MRCVSRRFRLLATSDIVWLPHTKKYGLLKGYNWQCSAMEMCRVAPHWKYGLFKQAFVARQKTRQIPWLCKEDNGLWLSKSSCIHYFFAQPSGHFVEDKTKCLQGGTEDLTRFVVKEKMVVSGCRDGSVSCWSTSGNHLVSYHQVHKSEIHSVDFADSVIVSGSRDTTCKVLRFDHKPSSEESILKTFEAGERVWSLKISPNQKIFAAGLAGCLDDPPVILWDLESSTCVAQLSLNHKRGAGVLDLKFESPNELLTCGYDTFIRLWDLRTHTCVRQWEEPFDSALYCIETDGEDTMVVGTARYGMVRLWDKRQTDPIQMMYCKNSHSPVYSVAMDYGHLYVALDSGLTIMDFT